MDSIEIIITKISYLNDLFGSNRKNIHKPWWLHFVFVFLALTCTGIYWIITGCQNKNNEHDDLDMVDNLAAGNTKNMLRQYSKRTVGICFGVLNMLSLVLLIFSLVFSWVIFAQIIFGIMTVCCAALPIISSIRVAALDFKYWRKEQTQEKIKTQAQRIMKWLKNGIPKEGPSKYQEINLNIYNKNDTIPKLLISSDEKNKGQLTGTGLPKQ